MSAARGNQEQGNEGNDRIRTMMTTYFAIGNPHQKTKQTQYRHAHASLRDFVFFGSFSQHPVAAGVVP
jgi:hypothetical protein